MNYFNNWKCLYDFRTSALNQQFVPDDPPVTGANDTGYITSPRADGTLAPVRVVFFPELGWGRGGKGNELRERIVRSLKQDYSFWSGQPVPGSRKSKLAFRNSSHQPLIPSLKLPAL